MRMTETFIWPKQGGAFWTIQMAVYKQNSWLLQLLNDCESSVPFRRICKRHLILVVLKNVSSMTTLGFQMSVTN